ncbi:MAG: FxDxF family PEP-CTERM protein [Gallionella sp.]
MKSTFSRMAAIALTMWLGLAGTAQAAGVATMSGWDGSASTGYSATFGNNGVSSMFDDTYKFSLPSDSTGNGKANVISLGGNDVLFTAFTLYENSIGLISGGTGGTTSSLSFTGGAVPGSYVLNVAGKKINASLAGSYAGNIVTTPCVVSPVPEPKTYGMMLLGLGLIGFSARRKIMNNA